MKPLVKTTIPGQKSIEVIQRMKKNIGKSLYIGLYGIILSKGKGALISDIDGNVFLDFLSGASVVNVGYGREDVIKTFADVSKRIQHTCFPYSPNLEAVELAEKFKTITPGNFDKRVIFGLTGSDSMDAGIKAARKFTKKRKVISFKNAYHGSTGISLQANGFPGLQKGLFLGEDFIFVDFPSNKEHAEKILNEIEGILKKGDVCAIVTEPVQGDGGNVVPPLDFHKKLSDLVHDYDGLFVVDEVQSGTGRSGKWWEIEYFNVVPDILATAKGITSGYAPLSVCIGREEIINSLDKAQHLFTYSAHPPSCAVANKVISIIEEEKLMENAKIMGNLLKDKLNELCKKGSCARKARGMGLHIGFEVIDPDTNKPLGGLFGLRCLEKGLYPGYFGPNNNVMRLHPPLIINKEQMQFAIDTISDVVNEWDSGKFPKETIENYKKVGVGLGTD